MQEEQQVELAIFFTDPLLLNYITEYLTIPQRLTISTLSKKLRYVMQEHFASLLIENQLNVIHGKSPIHQMHFYYNRCLRIFKFQRGENAKEEMAEVWQKKQRDGKSKKIIEEAANSKELLKISFQNPFKFRVISYFQVGPIFTVCIDNESRAFVFRTNKLLQIAQNKEQLKYVQECEVRSVSVKAEKMIMVKSSGEVCVLQADKMSLQLQMHRTTLPWSVHIPVLKVHASFTYALFQLQNAHFGRDYLLSALIDHNYKSAPMDQSQKCQEMLLIAFNQLSGIQYVVRVPGSRLLSVAVGHRDAYLINQRHECFIVQFQHLNQMQHQLFAKEFKPLSGRKIIKIFSGYNFFVAFERQIEFINQWSTDRVVEWLRDIGFGSFVRIARVQKLDGLGLKNISKKYLDNVLGMNKMNMQQKLMLCIQEVVDGKNQSQQLWVWGKNQFGQLGSANANYIAQPQRLKMDFLQSNDKIDKVFCGWFQTFVRTHRGKIYSTIRTSQRKKKKVVEEKDEIDRAYSDQQDFRRVTEQPRFKNKKRKATQDFREENKKQKQKGHKKFEVQQHWMELQAGKAFFVEAFKDFTFIIQCPDQHKFQPVKQKKLRPAKSVIDKIIWTGIVDKADFKIGYIDKDMGMIEVSPLQIQTFDYKESKVRYIKKNNVVVWDKQSKIDQL